MQVFLDGQYVAEEDAHVSVNDRGFLFADGIYEVIRLYDGRPFRMEAHLRRLADGLRALDIHYDDVEQIPEIAERLIDENDLHRGDATVYLQITRGAAPRKHAFPGDDVTPTVFVAARPFSNHPDRYFEEGVDAITVSDTRWTRCDAKTVSLLPNVLANQRAHAAGAFEALFVRDGVVLEGSHSNLFAVDEGELITYPATNHILAGITRAEVFDLADELGIPAREGLILDERLDHVNELFLSGTTTEVMPVSRVDGRAIGTGRPGPITERLLHAYRGRI